MPMIPLLNYCLFLYILRGVDWVLPYKGLVLYLYGL